MNEAQRAGMMSSATPEWATPRDLFDEYDAEFGFVTDVCAVPENAKCRRYFTPEQDGLAQEWTGACWMNPPYGRGIGAWIRKAWESAQAGATVVCLIPSRTDTTWWHEYVMRGEVRFLRGRIYFEPTYGGGTGDRAPFPSAVVVFRPPTTSVTDLSGIALVQTFTPHIEAENAALTAKVERLTAAINWATGAGDSDFGVDKDGEILHGQPPYWWRTPLVEKAGLVYSPDEGVYIDSEGE